MRIFPAADLHSYLDHVNRRVGHATTVTIQHLAELRTFEGLTPTELNAAAARHDLRIVRRMGGRQLGFTPLARA